MCLAGEDPARHERSNHMKSIKNLRTRSLMWVAAGAVAGLSLGATGLVHAATDGSSDSTTAPTEEVAPPASGIGGSDQVHTSKETPLTGDTADQVTAAAQAAEPGATVDRVETDDVHAYEAHVTLADGSKKILFFDESFSADGSEVPPADGRGGHGPRGDHAHDANGNDIVTDPTDAEQADTDAPAASVNG